MNRQLKLIQIYDELLESQTSKKIFLKKIEEIISWDERSRLTKADSRQGAVGGFCGIFTENGIQKRLFLQVVEILE